MKAYSLTFDFGSGSVKAALVGSDHRILASCSRPYSTYYPRKGWAVQSPDTAWASLLEATRQVMDAAAILPSQVKGIALSHTGSTLRRIRSRS